MRLTREYEWVFDAKLFKKHLEDYAENMNATQSEMSEFIGKSNGYISSMDTVTNPHPGMSSFLEICNFLDLRPLDYFTVHPVSGLSVNEHTGAEHRPIMVEVRPYVESK